MTNVQFRYWMKRKKKRGYVGTKLISITIFVLCACVCRKQKKKQIMLCIRKHNLSIFQKKEKEKNSK